MIQDHAWEAQQDAAAEWSKCAGCGDTVRSSDCQVRLEDASAWCWECRSDGEGRPRVGLRTAFDEVLYALEQDGLLSTTEARERFAEKLRECIGGVGD